MTFKEQSAFLSGYASSIKNDNVYLGTQNSTSGITGFFGKRSKIRSSCFVSEAAGEIEERNKNSEKNFPLINEEKERKNLYLKNKNVPNRLGLGIIEEENDKKIKSSGNLYILNNNKKSHIPLLEENKENVQKTDIDYSISENEKLFLKAIQECKFHLEKNKKKNKNLNFSMSSANEIHSKKYGNESDSEFINSDSQCNCSDILVVDDEEFNVMASQRMLKNLGFESDAAYNGEECIKLIKEKLKLNCKCKISYYKLIFLDIVMPIMDGIEAAKEIQKMIDKKILSDQTIIIFISGNIGDTNLKNSLLEINCVKECLQKPVKIEKYQKLIEKYYQNN